MAELERLRKQNAELLEWNRYYLEVTKERRKQVEELQAEVAEAWEYYEKLQKDYAILAEKEMKEIGYGE